MSREHLLHHPVILLPLVSPRVSLILILSNKRAAAVPGLKSASKRKVSLLEAGPED